MHDVAALAGVGQKTVSRVVNGEPNVSEDTRSKVEQAIATLKFVPHFGAGSLRRGGGRTQTLGVVVDAIDNPFSARIVRAIEAVASEHQVAVFAASSSDDPDRERALVQAFSRRRVDGLLISSHGVDQGYLHDQRDHGMPVVFVDRTPRGILGDTVLTDSRRWAAAATRHLIDHGHRRILFLGDDPLVPTAVDRLAGYRDELQAAGVAPDPRLEFLARPEQTAIDRTVVEALALPDPPTAIFSGQGLVTVAALSALHRCGRQHRTALVGFDDVDLADLLSPGVTVVAQDPAAIGRLGATRLFARLAGDTSPAEQILVPARLIQRGSGEIRPD